MSTALTKLQQERTGPAMSQFFYEAMKRHRFVLSAALMVGVVLILFVHAPIIPVLAGCLLAVAIVLVRARSGGKGRDGIRGGR
jgi:uncharacterized membrane protein YesL